MTFSAGSIEATLTLDRRPFQADLARAKKDAEDFARRKYQVSLSTDATKLYAELDKLKAKLDEITRDRTVRVKVKTEDEELDKTREKLKLTTHEFKINLLDIAALATPLVPLAGGLTAISTAAVGLGLSGITAFYGIRNEITKSTTAGLEYKSLLTSLKNDATSLSQTSALSIETGFAQAVGKLRADVPQLNIFLAKSSTILGDITQHLVGGLVGGFKAFSPLMLQVEQGIDYVAARFETWATGPGGAKFADTLTKDYQAALPVLKDIGVSIEHLLSALNGVGLLGLGPVSVLFHLLSELPVNVIKDATIAYVAFRTAVAVTAGIDAARNALLGLSAAEAAAGKASTAGALRTGLAGFLTKAGPYAAAIVGIGVATDALVKTNNSWIQSSNKAKEVIGGLAIEAKSLFSGHLGDFLTGKSVRAGLDLGDQGRQIDQSLERLKNIRTTEQDMAAASTAGYYVLNRTQEQIIKYAEVEKYASDNLKTLTASQAQLNSALSASSEPVSSASTTIQQYISDVSTAADNEKKWLTQGADTGKSVQGIEIYRDTLNNALKQTNGNYDDAIALILSHGDALKDDNASIATNTALITSLDTAIAKIEGTYGLTVQQVDAYAAALGLSATELPANIAAIGKLNSEVEHGSISFRSLIDAFASFNSGADTVATRAQLLGTAMVALQGDTLGVANAGAQAAQANQQFVDDFDKAKKSVVNLKTGVIDFHNAGAAPLLSDLSQLQTAAATFAEQVYQSEVATKGQTQASKDAATTFYNDTRNALIAEAKQLGITKEQATKLADTYFKWPKDAKTQVELIGEDKIQAALTGILEDLDKISGLHHATLDITMSAGDYALLQNLSAVESNTRNRFGAANADGNIYYANGGENHVAQIAPAGAWRVWAEPETGGEAYIPLAASKRARSRTIASATVHKLGGVAYFSNGGEQGGFTGVTSGSGGGSGGTTSKYKTLLSAITAELAKLATASKDSASQISSLVTSIESSAKTAQGYGLITSKILSAYIKDGTALINVANKLGTAEQKLKTDTASYNQLVSSDRSVYLGGFDIGTSGNGYATGILETLQNKVSDASKFSSEIAQARKLGLGQDFIKQLIKEGPTTAGANLQAILSEAASNPGYIAQLNSNYIQLGKLGGSLGTVDAGLTYGKELTADRAAVAADSKAQLAALAQIHKDLVAVEAAVKKKTSS